MTLTSYTTYHIKLVESNNNLSLTSITSIVCSRRTCILKNEKSEILYTMPSSAYKQCVTVLNSEPLSVGIHHPSHTISVRTLVTL